MIILVFRYLWLNALNSQQCNTLNKSVRHYLQILSLYLEEKGLYLFSTDNHTLGTYAMHAEIKVCSSYSISWGLTVVHWKVKVSHNTAHTKKVENTLKTDPVHAVRRAKGAWKQ